MKYLVHLQEPENAGTGQHYCFGTFTEWNEADLFRKKIIASGRYPEHSETQILVLNSYENMQLPDEDFEEYCNWRMNRK